MTKIAFELSGEHSVIPGAEVTGALEAEEIDFLIYRQFDQLLIIEIRKSNISLMDVLAKRLSMTWHIIQVLGICDAVLSDIIKMVESVEIDHARSLTYRIRTKKIKRKNQISSEVLERYIGKTFFDNGYRADLKDPDVQYRIVLSDGKCIFGKTLGSIDRSAFEHRNPSNKPFFYPGVVMPRLARAMVNIARTKRGSVVLDPYCGTGGILVEAGLIGAVTLGCDIQKKIIMGGQMNLDYYSVDYSIFLQDAGNMALGDECVDCIVTDPPYGRSAIIWAQSLDHLMRYSLKEMYRVLRPGGKAIVVSECYLDKLAVEAGFHVIEVYIQRVHRSLTRRITVLDKVS